MSILELPCDTCGRTTVFIQPDCPDGHGPDCPERACVHCGEAILTGELAGAPEEPQRTGTPEVAQAVHGT